MIQLSDTPVLQTERLTLRAPKAADWPVWRDFATGPRAQYIGGPFTGPGAAWRGFGHVIGHWVLRGFGMFVITRKGYDAPLGAVGPWYPDGWPEREIGWTLWRPEAEGQGLALEAATAARDFAFGTLGWDTAVSYIDLGNVRSIALAERLGARPDPDAAQPDFGPDHPVLIYRHPKGAAA